MAELGDEKIPLGMGGGQAGGYILGWGIEHFQTVGLTRQIALKMKRGNMGFLIFWSPDIST